MSQYYDQLVCNDEGRSDIESNKDIRKGHPVEECKRDEEDVIYCMRG